MPRSITIRLVLLMMLSGCTPGVYERLDSSAPFFGPICPGTTRHDAERHLGPPLLTVRLDGYHYQNIYLYELARSARHILVTDVMDFVTFGLGKELVSPIDRFAGTKHLIAVTYLGADQDLLNDRIVSITDRVSEKLDNCVLR